MSFFKSNRLKSRLIPAFLLIFVLVFSLLIGLSNPVFGQTNEAHTPGSNTWAITPSHSASGKTLLLANPHLYWSDLFFWYEAQLTAPSINAYGAS